MLNFIIAVTTIMAIFLGPIENMIGHEISILLQLILGVILLKADKITAVIERRRLKKYVKNKFEQAKKRGAIIPIVLPRD